MQFGGYDSYSYITKKWKFMESEQLPGHKSYGLWIRTSSYSMAIYWCELPSGGKPPQGDQPYQNDMKPIWSPLYLDTIFILVRSSLHGPSYPINIIKNRQSKGPHGKHDNNVQRIETIIVEWVYNMLMGEGYVSGCPIFQGSHHPRSSGPRSRKPRPARCPARGPGSAPRPPRRPWRSPETLLGMSHKRGIRGGPGRDGDHSGATKIEVLYKYMTLMMVKYMVNDG